MKPECAITVFTAAYNRPETLRRVCASLEAQTFRDFEWLIVDDGSGPAVRAAVEQMQREAGFPIRYIWQENRGKHAAHNRAGDEAHGRYFVVLDDDDTCIPVALERFNALWNEIPEGERARYASILSRCMDQNGVVFGEPFPGDPYDTDYLSLFLRAPVAGEKWGCFRTEVVRDFPYPVAAGPSAYMAEGVTWYRMGRLYRTRCVNEVLRTWYVGHYSQSSREARKATDYRRIAPTMVIVHGQQIQEFMDLFWYAPKHFAKAAANYTRFSIHAGVEPLAQWRTIGNLPGRLLWLAMLPWGVALYLRDRSIGAARHRSSQP